MKSERMKLILLIAKHPEENPQIDFMYKGSYNVGWFIENKDGSGIWTVWGNSKNRAAAVECAKDILRKKGDREILIWDEPLPKVPYKIPAELMNYIRENQKDKIKI